MNHISKRGWHLDRIFPAFTLLLMVGCAELNSIYRSQTLPKEEPHLTSIDSKQRVVLSNPVKTAKITKTERGTYPASKNDDVKQPQTYEIKIEAAETTITRFCAEPPPDVFTAIASSLGLEGSLSKSAVAEAAAKLASTISENAATIERSQTVNILREAMYRNCERYLSGAITAEEFIVQASRDQRMIVQVLAVEQITGVARAQSTALTTVAKAAAGGVSEYSLTALSEAKKDVEAKRAVSQKAEESAKSLPPAGLCGTSDIDTSNPPNGVSEDQAKAKNEKCAVSKTAAKLTKESEDFFALVQQTVAKQGAVSAETHGQLASAALSASASGKEIASKVVEIVRLSQDFNEVEMTCVVMLRTRENPPPYCTELVGQLAATESARSKVQESLFLMESGLNIQQTQYQLSQLTKQTQSNADLVWKALNNRVTPENLSALVTKAGIELSDVHRMRLENAGGDFSKFSHAFKRLSANDQLSLANASK